MMMSFDRHEIERIDSSPSNKLGALYAYINDRDAPTKSAVINEILGRKEYTTTIRMFAARLAQEYGDEDTIALLSEIVRTEIDEKISGEALVALASRTNGASIAVLTKWLEEEPGIKKLMAVRAADMLSEDLAVDFLLSKALKHEDENVKYISAVYIASRGMQEGAHIFAEMLDHASDPSAYMTDQDLVYATLAAAILGNERYRDKALEILQNTETLGLNNRSVITILSRFRVFKDIPENELKPYVIDLLKNQFEAR
jgi:hypothetical protein